MNGRRASWREKTLGLVPEVDLVDRNRRVHGDDGRGETRRRELMRYGIEVRAAGDAVILDRAAVVGVREEIREAKEAHERERGGRSYSKAEVSASNHVVFRNVRDHSTGRRADRPPAHEGRDSMPGVAPIEIPRVSWNLGALGERHAGHEHIGPPLARDDRSVSWGGE